MSVVHRSAVMLPSVPGLDIRLLRLGDFGESSGIHRRIQIVHLVIGGGRDCPDKSAILARLASTIAFTLSGSRLSMSPRWLPARWCRGCSRRPRLETP